MTKQFIFLLVLVLIMMSSTLTAFAAGEIPAMELVTEEKIPPSITSPGGIEYYQEKYEEVFFSADAATGEDFLVTLSTSRDTRALDPLRYIVTGSVLGATGETVTSVQDTAILLLYIKRDGVYVPLNTIDARLYPDTNMVETPLLVYAKVLLDNLGNDTVNELRVVAFRKADADHLVPGVNLQITDLRVVARTTFLDRVRIGMDTILNSVNPITR